MTYYDYLDRVDDSEEYDGQLFRTIWKTHYFLSRFPYKPEQGVPVPLPLTYRSINDHDNNMKLRQAEVTLNGFLIETYLDHLVQETLSFDSSTLRMTIPYSWKNNNDHRGSGDIELVFNPESSTIQLFFQKNWMNGFPLFTSSYTINIRTGLNRISRDDPATAFQSPGFNEGDGKPPHFEDVEEFLFQLIQVSSDYATRAMQLSFALMLASDTSPTR